jgi:hypothetical protein
VPTVMFPEAIFTPDIFMAGKAVRCALKYDGAAGFRALNFGKIMALYELRFSFDTGSGICLWPDNDAARERFGFAIHLDMLGLPEMVVAEGQELVGRHDTWMDWDNAPDDLWSDTERSQFNHDASAFLEVLRDSLGADFAIKG